MVLLKFNGDNETFFHFHGKRYTTKNKEIDIEDKEAIEYILKNPRWSKSKKVINNGSI